jgi:hypothetical protein
MRWRSSSVLRWSGVMAASLFLAACNVDRAAAPSSNAAQAGGVFDPFAGARGRLAAAPMAEPECENKFFEWQGHNLMKIASATPIGPAENRARWSCDQVSVDPVTKELILRVTRLPDGSFVGGEVEFIDGLNAQGQVVGREYRYGTYSVALSGIADTLQPSFIFSPFSYTGPPTANEIDVEISNFNDALKSGGNIKHTVWPRTPGVAPAERRISAPEGLLLKSGVHEYGWSSDKVTFTSTVSSGGKGNSSRVYSSILAPSGGVPQTYSKFLINAWVYATAGQAPIWDPAVSTMEVRIKSVTIAAESRIIPPPPLYEFFDDFSGDLSKWVQPEPSGAWRIENGELRGDYNIGCGAPFCPQTPFLIRDDLQPTGTTWTMDVESNLVEAFCCYIGGQHTSRVHFMLWVSPTEKTQIIVGKDWTPSSSLEAVASTAYYSVQRWPWTQLGFDNIAVAPWTTNQWQKATLERDGNTYRAYWNGTMLYETSLSFSQNPKIGVNTYGASRNDNVRVVVE